MISCINYIIIFYNTTVRITKVYDLNMTQKELMEAAYYGEMCTPSQCGRMDQCVAMGSGSVGLMEFDQFSCDLKIVPCKDPLYFVVADLKVCVCVCVCVVLGMVCVCGLWCVCMYVCTNII